MLSKSPYQVLELVISCLDCVMMSISSDILGLPNDIITTSNVISVLQAVLFELSRVKVTIGADKRMKR